MKEVTQETNRPAQNIPYRNINGPFRFQFVIPGEGIEIKQDANGIKFISAEGGLSVADIVAGDNIYIEVQDGKLVISAVDSVTNIAAGQNVTITYDQSTGDFIISALVGSSADEHYQGVFDTVDDLIAYDTNPDTGDYGMIKDIVVSDGETSWNGKYKYCFYINGAWTVVDQMLTFTDDTDLLQQFYSVGGSSPVIYLHKIAQTGSFWSLKDAPIVATPDVEVKGNTITVTCATEGADIWYTTDGTMPHVNGTKYTGPITVVSGQTFRFVGVKNGMINSLEAVAGAGYSLEAPKIELDWTDGTITMTNPNQTGDIYYTTDNTTPTSASTLYTGPFVINAPTSFNLIVIDGGTESAVTTQSYRQVQLDGRHTGGNGITGYAVYGINAVLPDSENPGEVHYTDNGNTPLYTDALLDNTFSMAYYSGLKTIKTRGFADGYVPSLVDSYNYGSDKPVSPPIFFDAETNTVTLVNSTFVNNDRTFGRITGLYGEVEFRPVSASAPAQFRSRIYYTLDGTTPTSDSTFYSGPFTITGNVTVKAIVVSYGQYVSDVSTLAISMLEAPVITLDSNTGAITIQNPNSTGSIYYTTDNSTPTSASTLYSAPFVLNTTTMVKAIVISGSNESPVTSFVAAQYDAPTFVQNIDYLTGKRSVAIKAGNSVTNIHYTLDGSTPTAESATYSSLIQLPLFGSAVTVKAIKIYPGYLPTPVATLSIEASTPDAPTITYDSDAGTVSLALSGNTTEIALQTNTNVPSVGARIWYTTDGSTPTAQNGTLWTGTPFAVEAGQTIKAVTVCYSTDSSSVATENIPGGADYLYFEAKQASSTVSMVSMLPTAPSFEYSEDGTTWTAWDSTQQDMGGGTLVWMFDTITLANIGDKVYLRGNNTTLNNIDEDQGIVEQTIFMLTGLVDSGGNIVSLLDNTGESTSITNDHALAYLFMQCTALATAPSLGNVTTLGPNALRGLFQNCTSLTTAMNMDNLTTIGERSLNQTYDGCSALTSAADMPKVTSIGERGICNMYSDCSSLTTAADMPIVSTFETDAIQGMYANTTNLTLVSDGALTFEFPTLPVTVGSTTLSTPADVETLMKDNT